MLKTYPSFTRDFIDTELPMDEAWVYYAWSQQNDPMAQLSGITMASKGYIGQEVERILKEKQDAPK